jgi:hypothetical protein
MNYFYDLPEDLQNKILERKKKLERIDELKDIIYKFKKAKEDEDEEWLNSNPAPGEVEEWEKGIEDLLEKEYDELYDLSYELWEEDQSGFSYNSKFKRKDNVITIYDTTSEEDEE